MSTLQAISKTVLMVVAVAAMSLTGFASEAEVEIVPSALDVSEAPRFVGPWKLEMSVEGREFELYLNIVDINGKIGATVDSAMQPEPQVIENITKLPDGSVDFEYEMPFGGQSFTMHITAQESGGRLIGKLEEANQIFSAPFEAEEGSPEIDTARRASPTESNIRLNGEKIRVTFGNLKDESQDYQRLTGLTDGDVFQYVGSRATKFFTDVDLAFGDSVIKTENFAKDYPGVYSLWLKRSGNQWSLIFNSQPDVWGTMHDAGYDVAEVPLQVATLDDAKDEFIIVLEKSENGGQMRLAWGTTEWSTDFKLAQ